MSMTSTTMEVSSQIRTKFLSRIGLMPHPSKTSQEPNSNGPLTSTPTSPPDVVHTVCSVPIIPLPPVVTRPAVNIQTEALKYDALADAHFSKRRKTTSAQSSMKTRRKKRLAFHETVVVVPIPMRNEYSSRVRSRLWTGAAELYENAARNTVEFAHEGWDWRKVTEDELMHVCVATGELIHPCHYSLLHKEQANV